MDLGLREGAQGLHRVLLGYSKLHYRKVLARGNHARPLLRRFESGRRWFSSPAPPDRSNDFEPTEREEAFCLLAVRTVGTAKVRWLGEPAKTRRLRAAAPMASLWEGIYDSRVPAVSPKRAASDLCRHVESAFGSATFLNPRIPFPNQRSLLLVLRDMLRGWDLQPKAVDVQFLQDRIDRYRGDWLHQPRRLDRLASASLVWHPRERAGFFLNRLLSYRWNVDHATGMAELGSQLPAFRLAWKSLWRSWVGSAAHRPWEVLLGSDKQENLLALALRFAKDRGVEVWDNDELGLDGCLVRTKGRDVIHLGRELPLDRRAWLVCHELAHLELKHLANTSYGCDSRKLTSEGILYFERQEREADALASVWVHLLQGLREFLELGGVQKVDPDFQDRHREPSRSEPEEVLDPEPWEKREDPRFEIVERI